MIPPRLRLISFWTLAVLIAVVLAGATYQGVATALERRKYPHPGMLVDVGGHQLHIYCVGAGAPTVVLEAPATGLSVAWARVQPEVGKRTRVCSYDRAGLGWSEAGDRPYDPGRVPEELHALLGAAKAPGPFVIVGSSLGASFVRRFAVLYPHESAGLVLIDPPGEQQPPASGFLNISPWLARAGLLRATGVLSDDARNLPQPAGGAVRSFLNRPDHLTRAARESARWDDAVRLAQSGSLPAGLPVATLRIEGRGDELAILSDEVVARRVSTAILDMVTRLRRSRK